MEERSTASSPEIGLDMLTIRLIEAGHGQDVSILEEAILALAEKDEQHGEGTELSDVLAHLRASGQAGAAGRVEEAVRYLERHGAPATAPRPSRPDPTPAAPGREVRQNVWPIPAGFPDDRLAKAPPADLVRHAYADDDAGLRSEIDRVRWFHSVDFGGGARTTGQKPLEILRAEADLIFAVDLVGKTVLDVGAWDGFFSLEATRRGARRVLATDWHAWGGPGWGSKAGFDLVKRTLAPSIEEMEADIPDLNPETVGRFSVVLFLGVLYHLQHPLLAVQQLADLTLDHLVLETQMDMLDVDRPAAAFYPWRELSHDNTNWWGPNVPCVAGMLGNAGFRQVYFTRHPTEHSRGIFHAFK